MAEDHKPTIITDFPGQAVEKQLRETGALPNEVCYADMDSSTLLEALADDAAKWASAFNQHARKIGYQGMDEGWLISWFANAIEHSADVRRWRSQPPTTPVDISKMQ